MGSETVSTPEPSSIISLLILGTANLGYCLKRKILG
ncbi:MAG: PEP-CTERM sorting domain-containing protein [Okeania sp. SIO2C9]|nr:PEP-CTERM sorting domain-containing protein [Okeania sp. SIO2C9]